MLKELGITHFAIIDRLNLAFEEGLNVISGETGTGKSILIGAIGLLLGDRASADLIRTDEDAAVVEAVFDIAAYGGLREKLNAMGFRPGRELAVKRVVSRSGKNRVYIDGNLATVAMLEEISRDLVHVCSQHEHQRLLDAETHLDILDEFGPILEARLEYAEGYASLQELRSSIDALQERQRTRAEREDLIRFQLGEIERASVKPGEDAARQEEKKLLANAAKLAEWSHEAHELLYGSEDSVLRQVSRAAACIREIRRIDPGFAVSEEEFKAASIQLEDAARALREYEGRISMDPGRLEEIEDRLALLGRLKKKYGGSLEGVLKTASDLKSEMEELSGASTHVEELTREFEQRVAGLLKKAQAISAERRRAAQGLEKAVEEEIRALRMDKACFRVHFREPDDGSVQALHARGIDDVEFLLTTNVGEPLKPLDRIASGGELSRIVLALKKVLAGAGSVGTMIFDEVDSGIGGATAEIVGRKLREIARHHQVLCITHLPQIASFGHSHYRVTKTVFQGRTRTDVEPLEEDERIEEITRMLGGVEITDKTRAAAREMVRMARKEEGEKVRKDGRSEERKREKLRT